jgi:hypothetical protein
LINVMRRPKLLTADRAAARASVRIAVDAAIEICVCLADLNGEEIEWGDDHR